MNLSGNEEELSNDQKIWNVSVIVFLPLIYRYIWKYSNACLSVLVSPFVMNTDND